MPSFEVHCRECVEKLGSPYPHVHKFLDQFAGRYRGKSHRKFLHNKKGIGIVRKKWGKGAEKAAILHINRDKKEGAIDIVRNFGMDLKKKRRRKWR